MAKSKNAKKLSFQELSAVFSSFTMLLRAGVPANECPGIAAEDMKDTHLGVVCGMLDKELTQGKVYLLSEAMENANVFPAYAKEMVQLGEDSGRLETVFDSLGEYYWQQGELTQSIRGAINGPLLLLLMMSVVLFFLIVFVLPIYDRVYTALGVVDGIGIRWANIAARIAMAVSFVLLLLFLVSSILYMTQSGRRWLLKLTQRAPVAKRIHYAISVSHLTQGVSMLLASGLTSRQALTKANALVHNPTIAAKMPACIRRVEEGEDIGKALVDQEILTGFEAKVLISASKAGQTETAMARLSDIYATQATAGIDTLVSLAEPVLVAVLSVTIGTILLSVMLPLLSIMSAIH